MAAALEERITREVLDRNEAIEALKEEVEVLGAKKTRLVAEVGGLSIACVEAENLRKEIESLRKQVEAGKTTESLAITSRMLKTIKNLIMCIIRA
jgi:predicted RNase H-like nuclease (RuvC/YqgF family)